MNEKEANEKLNANNNKRIKKFNLLKEFESKHIGGDLKSRLEIGFSSCNPKFKYSDYLRYYFLPFAFENQINNNDLNLLAIQKNEIGFIYYSIYLIAIKIEEVHHKEIINWFLQCYICLGQMTNNPKEIIHLFLEKELLKNSQIEFFKNILNNYELHYKGFIGTYNIVKKPYFHFELILY